MCAVILAFFFCFWFFVYRPQIRRLISIQREFNDTEAQIVEITQLAHGQDFAQAVKGLEIKFGQLSNLIPKGEDEIINNLSEEARRLKIKVENITSSGGRLLDYQVAGYSVEESPISMNLICEYRQLGEYLKSLRDNFPVLVRIKQVEIQAKGATNPDLEVSLQILAFISKGS
ncbi:MAG: hypothetical protein FJZ11_03030 [Candidatus Omnitrophica bacterium]|nr:hypothetical protein [Candidatus Omnitrophota bacterium]